MNIQVLGSGCPTCKKLHKLTLQAVNELKIDEVVDYVTDVQKIIEMGIMSSPALVINNKVVLAGSVPNVEKIKNLINGQNTEKTDDAKGCCSCGGKC